MRKAKYFVSSFAVGLIVFSLILFPIGLRIKTHDSSAEIIDSDTTTEAVDKNSINVLMMLTNPKGEAESFAILRIDPVACQIATVSLPLEMRMSAGGEESNITGCYKYGGIKKVCSQLSDEYGIPIEKFFRTDKQGFIEIINLLGSLEYNLPYPLNYRNEKDGEFINIPKGRQKLDGTFFYELITFPQYKEGIMHKYKIQNNASEAYINQRITAKLLERGQSVFLRIIDKADTNISLIDYEGIDGGLRHIVGQNKSPGMSLNLSGTIAGDIFVPDSVSCAELVRIFAPLDYYGLEKKAVSDAVMPYG